MNDEPTCRKCGAPMLPSQALAQTYTGVADFPGGEVVTMSPGGGGKLIKCLKCSQCGHSVRLCGESDPTGKGPHEAGAKLAGLGHSRGVDATRPECFEDLEFEKNPTP